MDKKYPTEEKITIAVPKEGYNAITMVREAPDSWVFELYNPNVKPEEPKVEPETAAPEAEVTQ